ncbi:MAG: ABC transporter permease [Actinomycetaceae bacterium]|nr:ABC transporter permease [Actinomycetaceae bacterium]
MRALNVAVILSALTEAWQEVKIQKARVILSLVGVVAAVTAMSTVIALSEIMNQANQEEIEAMSGRDTTITLNVMEKSGGEDDYDMMMGGVGGMTIMYDDGQDDSQSTEVKGTASDLTNAPLSDEVLANFEKVGWNASDIKPSVFSRATQILVSRFSLSHYSRLTMGEASIPEVTKALTDGQYKGRPVNPEGYMADMMAEYAEGGDGMSMGVYIESRAVDTSYNTIYRLRMETGRWLAPGDVNQQVTPVVINSILWSALAKTPLNEGLVLTLSGGEKVRVVGVVQAKNKWENPIIYMPYDSWELMNDKGESSYTQTALLVWVDPSQADEARKSLKQTLSSLLGDKYEVSIDDMMAMMMGDNEDDGTQTIVLIIGAIVILLGILGLVNVAIVTVRQRIREIGIRRAVGASAKRVFFAVFLESVVATFIAGLIGVMLSILIVRNFPLEWLYIYLQDPPGFPMSTAITALLISTGIGALAGIIPAATALKVKPIDAIRY